MLVNSLMRYKTAVLTALLCILSLTALHAQLYVTSQFIAVDEVEAGQQYTGEVSVLNGGDREELIRLSLKDHLFTADGRSRYLDPGYVERSNAPWIQFDQDEFTVQPDEEVTARYTVRVPAASSLQGSYWSIIMVESITDSGLNPDEEGLTKVTPSLRFGIQVVTAIGDSGDRDVSFFNPELHMRDSQKTFSVSIENTGERHLNLKSSINLYSDDGVFIGKFSGNKKICYPGTSVRLSVPLASVPMRTLEPGKYRIQFIADGGNDDLFGALYAITLN